MSFAAKSYANAASSSCSKVPRCVLLRLMQMWAAHLSFFSIDPTDTFEPRAAYLVLVHAHLPLTNSQVSQVYEFVVGGVVVSMSNN